MSKITKEAALEYHEEGRPGKIEVVPTKPYSSQRDLSLAYSPGVAFPCKEIEKNPLDVYRYTNKGNLVGVISNGTAVLGLGDIGALAGKPVMEGKALLFKIFGGLDAFDIELNQKDPDKFVEAVKAMEPTFGGINLEDIKAPECFEIERRLKEELNIPVMHDDQHGTAIISSAGLINALDLQGKKIGKIRLVVNGAGAAAISCTRLYKVLGVRPENIVMCDSKGVIRADRPSLSPEKKEFATTRDIHTLAEAMVDADVFLGLSKGNVLSKKMVASMAPRPIVFALANPDPEISYENAREARKDVIIATGRSDYPNQINNVIGFPYIFRGALDCHATAINEEMKVAAVYAIASLAKEPVPSLVDEAYGLANIKYGPDYILPKALDPRLLACVAPAVAKAAVESGVARCEISDWDKYREYLESIMGDEGKLIRHISDIVRKDPKRVVFSQGSCPNMIRAAARLAHEGTLHPILLGNKQTIADIASEIGLDVSGVDVIDTHDDDSADARYRYADRLWKLKQRSGMTLSQAREFMHERVNFGMMMVRSGDADAFLGGSFSAANEALEKARDIIGIQDGYSHFATMHIAITRQGTFFLADTAVNPEGGCAALVDIARLTSDAVSYFGFNPTIAMLSYSNFGSNANDPEPREVAKAVEILHSDYPDICVDGEMQANYALDTDLRDQVFPFNKLRGLRVNTLVFPSLGSANIAYKMLLGLGVGTIIGPIQMGLRRPIYFTSMSSTEREIVNLATIAALDAYVTANCQSDRCQI
ncbi:MAG: NADP-dependent malic enzyme [Muribaculaceae bacterium]|nr:NADP-dependent malic enzyme [Muribaculaceae bacterium]